MEINAQKKVSRINKEIYGHFSEHLGRCIYNGIFVGTDSKIPNNKGMRKDAVEALRKWAYRESAGADVLQMSIIGWMG